MKPSVETSTTLGLLVRRHYSINIETDQLRVDLFV